MRNPIRLKNLRPRFLPFYLVAGVLLLCVRPEPAAYLAVFLAWFLLAYFPRKEHSEAARLEALHGRVFADYRAEVPALIPRLQPWRPAVADRLSSDPLRWSLARYSENNELGTLLGLIACSIGFGLRTWPVV